MTSQNNPSSETEIAALFAKLNALGVTTQDLRTDAQQKPRRTRRPRTTKTPSNQCIARIWKSAPTVEYPKGRPGYGSRCTKAATMGDFCKLHGKPSNKKNPCPDKKCVAYGEFHQFTWEHCGRYDEPCPTFFNSSVWATCVLSPESDYEQEPQQEQDQPPQHQQDEQESQQQCEEVPPPPEQPQQRHKESVEETMALLFGNSEDTQPDDDEPQLEEDDDEHQLEEDDDDEPQLEEDDDEPQLEEDDDEPQSEEDDDDEPQLED